MMPRAFSLALAMTIAASSAAQATVLTGSISNLPESTGMFCWGDGTNDLCQQWSFRNPNSGWFYGSNRPPSNADVYVYHGLADPTSVTNAESFPYTNELDWADEGDTVFFRGTNGFYGAWKIVSIDPQPGFPMGDLDGQWYFQTDRSGCFAPNCGVTAAAHRTWGSIKLVYR